jgi:hypothetical protein
LVAFLVELRRATEPYLRKKAEERAEFLRLYEKNFESSTEQAHDYNRGPTTMKRRKRKPRGASYLMRVIRKNICSLNGY